MDGVQMKKKYENMIGIAVRDFSLYFNKNERSQNSLV